MLSAILAAISSAVLQSATEAIAGLGAQRHARRGRRLAAQEALASTITPDLHDYPNRITPRQVDSLQRFVESPQFAHLVLHAAVAEVAGKPKQQQEILWAQVSHSLRLTGQFTGADLLEATDFVLAAIGGALAGTELSAIADRRFEHLPLAADLAAAGARNGDLLAGLAELHEFNRFADDMCAAVAVHHARVRVSHAGQTRTAPYDQLYVVPHLRQSSIVGWLDADADAEDAGELGGTAASLTDLVTRSRRSVVLGDPGAGKSTFAAKLVHDVATGRVRLPGVVPLLLVVREHTESLRNGHELILHYLTALCRRPYQVEPPAKALEYLLLNGRALVVVDGLDELGDARHRELLTRTLEAFAHRYPAARIVVTSRVVGYLEVPLDAQLFPMAEIAPFTRAQVGQYVAAFFGLDERFQDKDRSTYVAAFLRESEAADEIRRNPLMLSLLCTLYTSLNFIPRNKPELYEKCAELLFETWDRSRGIEVAHRFESYIKPAVQRLAWKLLNDPDARQAIPRAELTTDLSRFLAKKYLDEDEAAQAAEDFIDFCTGRAWVLAEVGSDQLQPSYGFVHRTFLEYFAANQLVKNDPRPDAVWDQISGRLTEGGWEVAVQLAVQLLDRWHEDGADMLLSRALAGANELRQAGSLDGEAGVLRFCVRALESVTPGNDILGELTFAAARLACSVTLDERQHLGYATRWQQIDGTVDLPLALLLTEAVKSDPRVAKWIVDALHAFHDGLPGSASADVIFGACLLHGLGDAVAADGRAVPPAVRRWQRLMTVPSPDDVRKLGAQVLVTTTRALGAAYSPLSGLVTGVSKRIEIDDDLIETLTILGPALVERWPDLRPARSEEHKTELGQTSLTEAWLSALPVPARCTATLLALVGRDLGMVNPDMGDPLEDLWSRRTVRDASARLALPEDVVHLVIEWVGERDWGRGHPLGARVAPTR